MRKKGLLLIILAILFLIPACHRADHGDDIVVTVLPNPTAGTPTESPVPTESPTLTGTEPIAAEHTGTTVPTAPEVTDTPTTTAPAPTDMPEPTVTEYAATPTPTQVPYEGYVIGKDVNNNELKMAPQEADDFVMAGNILKLYDGSWFDIDDDGEPEYVSIQPYGCWTDTDQCYHIVFSGYDWIPLEVVAGDDRQDIPRENDVFVCITSMDGITKEIITFGTDTIGGDSWTRSEYYVFRS